MNFRNQEYFDGAAAWSRLDDDARTMVGAIALEIAFCQGRRTYPDFSIDDSRINRTMLTLLSDLLYEIACEALPDLLAMHQLTIATGDCRTKIADIHSTIGTAERVG